MTIDGHRHRDIRWSSMAIDGHRNLNGRHRWPSMTYVKPSSTTIDIEMPTLVDAEVYTLVLLRRDKKKKKIKNQSKLKIINLKSLLFFYEC